jgi:anti-anti-sigma factor
MRSASPRPSPAPDDEPSRETAPLDLPEPFRCDVHPERAAVRVVPHGELDLSSTPQLEARLNELIGAGWSCIAVDLGELSFIDSSGVNLLIRFARSARADGWSLELRPGRQPVQRVFELTGTTESLPFSPDGDRPLRPDP